MLSHDFCSYENFRSQKHSKQSGKIIINSENSDIIVSKLTITQKSRLYGSNTQVDKDQ